MKVLVTGGAGFIGRHIVDLLLDRGADVRVVDLKSDGVDPRAELTVGDIRDKAVTRHAVDGVDAVCHQAAMVGLGVDFGDVGSYVAHNDVGTAAVLQALWESQFRGRFVLASSMVVYGEGQGCCSTHGVVRPRPRVASDLAAARFEQRCSAPGCDQATAWVEVDELARLDPRNVYAATKVHQEHLCNLWGRESGATVVALRYHNVYGPGMPRDTPYAGVASIFLSALSAGRAPLVFEDGGQTRDFVHVRDVARANFAALTAADVDGGAYNIASGTPHTVGEMAIALTAGFGANAAAPQVTGTWRLGDVRHIVASARKAAEQLGFVAEIGFSDGMASLATALRQDQT